MNTNKKLKIMGIIIAFTLCFPLHFLYDKLPCFLTSIIAPVNESIWEHMKLLFGSIIISGIIQKIIVKSKKIEINNICFSNFIAAISSIPIFLLIYLPIYYIIGENFIITIVIMFIAITTSEFIAFLITNRKKDLGLENISILFVILTYLVFALLTYFPPQFDLFLDPESITYGIKSS